MAERRRLASSAEKVRSAKISAFGTKFQKLFIANIRPTLEAVAALPAKPTLKTPGLGALQVAGMLNDIQQTLEREGFWTGRRKEFLGLYADEIQNLRDMMNAAGVAKVTFSGADEKLITQIADYDWGRLTAKASDYISDIQGSVMRQMITGQEIDVPAELERVDTRLPSQIETEVTTAIHSFNRAWTAKVAIDAFGENPNFEYVGPDDDVTRPFCEKVLTDRKPPIYSLDEIEAMDNGQTDSVLEDGGGWNCRHDWYVVEPEEAAQ